MTRTQLLQLLLQQAKAEGFEFKKWFPMHTGVPWPGGDAAVDWLSYGERSSVLLFSHGFARAFWRSGQRVTFVVPAQAFQRIGRNGTVTQVDRKAHLRKSSRENVWEFHLREMAAAPSALRYIRRYLNVQEVVKDVLAEPARMPPPVAKPAELEDEAN